MDPQPLFRLDPPYNKTRMSDPTLAPSRVPQAHGSEQSQNKKNAKMEAKANIADDNDDNEQKKNLNAIRTHEAHVVMYQKVKVIQSKHNKSGFTSIEVPMSWPATHSATENLQDLSNPKEAKEWKTVDLPDKIVYYLLTHNRLHFGQAPGTPFTTPQFTCEIDWIASTYSAVLNLHGNYTSNELTNLQVLLLNNCQSPKTDASSPQLAISKFKSWSKRTSTSPSSLHPAI
jgi:hypothetical protein